MKTINTERYFKMLSYVGEGIAETKRRLLTKRLARKIKRGKLRK